MSNRSGVFDWPNWPGEVTRLLDEHHLVVLSDSPSQRRKFTAVLADYLSTHAQTQVILIDGEQCDSPQGLLEQLGAASVPNASLHDVAAALSDGDHPPARRFIIWNDAHLSMDTGITNFGRLVNTLLGVAAEFEHLSSEPLVLQRLVFVGDAKLGAYAEDEHGQFQSWLSDDDDDESPVWEAATVLDRPQVLTYRIDG